MVNPLRNEEAETALRFEADLQNRAAEKAERRYGSIERAIALLRKDTLTGRRLGEHTGAETPH